MWLSRLVRFVPGLGSPYLLAGVAIAAFGAGGWTVHKFVKAAEVKSLEMRLAGQKAAAKASEAALRDHYNDLLAIERRRVTIHEVTRYVPDNRACDLSRAAERMLDTHRQGLPEPSAGAATNPVTAAAAPRISHRQHVLAHADLADRFNQCRSQLIRLNEWYDNLEKRP